jgi:uncharacterized protein involved in response to NO
VDLQSRPWLDRVVIGAMVGVAFFDLNARWHAIAGVVAALAALLQAWRFIGWRSLRTRDESLVWSLHLAYAWLPVGLALKAIYLLTGTTWSAYWLHALTIGVAASMVLAVMTRAALGHTGRPLAAARSIAIAYVLVNGAAAVRVFAPSLAPVGYRWTVLTSGALWVTAFALFLITYTPILMRPRVDSKPG